MTVNSSPSPPSVIRTESELDDALSRPTEPDIEAMARLDGDLMILGASGKMGPSLARLAWRASDAAGVQRTVFGVARFTDPASREPLERAGVTTMACDLLDPTAATALPDCPNVVFMVGQKFGTEHDRAATWATNCYATAIAATRYAASRIVAFSTGNVYPLTPVALGGSRESDAVAPVGEYAQSALGRERILEFCARTRGTRVALLRLNYAVELRYGVLRDLADKVASGTPIDLTMGHVNVIWQRDANSIALRSFPRCASPPFVLNVTGDRVLAVRSLADQLARRLGRDARFEGREAETALLSNATLCAQLYGPPTLDLDAMLDHVAAWVAGGGRSLGRATHYDERQGRF